MRKHRIDQFVVGQRGIIETQVVIRRAIDSYCVSHPEAIRSRSVSREGGVLRYSMIVGSTPALRISASVLREVPQLGL